MEHIEIRPLSAALGAEIFGIDMAKPLEHATVAQIRQAFLEYLVIFFRDQRLTPADLLTFARLFGEPMLYPQLKGLPGYPLVTAVIKREHELTNFGGVWHSDTAYLECPPMASLLYALETPPQGGDTLFANQYLAYDTLPAHLKKTLDGLVGVNSSAKPEASRTREDRQRESGEDLKVMMARHPVERTHPETGRKSLYVNVGHTTRLEGLSEQESDELLAELFKHQISPDFVARFQWAPGSLAFWDNRCTLHYPLNDYHGHRRVMHRVTVAGDQPV
jgi:taurine dioxygenase